MSTNTTKLLRRTFAGLGAALLLASGAEAFAQGTVTLTGTAGNTCSYSQMTVTPNGNIQVTCGEVNSNIANFGLSHSACTGSSCTLSPNTQTSATVMRSGGPSEALMVMYNVTGTGCATSSGGIMLLAAQSQTIPFTIGAAGTNCTVSIAMVSGSGNHTVSPSTLTFTSGTSGGGGGGGGGTNPPPGCPAMPSTSIIGDVAKVSDFQGVDNRFGVPSGVILYYPVPASPSAASVKVQFSQGATARTPDAGTEYQVSKCPGVFVDPGTLPAQCKYSSASTNQNEITIWTAVATATSGVLVDSQAAVPTACFATGNDNYINVRWTYRSPCPADFVGGCGFSIRWNQYLNNSIF